MAVGQVSTTNITPWQLVSTVTTTSGTTATFSSLAGYSKYMLCWNGVTLTSGSLLLRFNGSSTNYASLEANNTGYNGETTGITLSGAGANAAGFIEIFDALSAGPKRIEGVNAKVSYPGYLRGVWNNTDAITSMVVTAANAYTAGTWTLYGIAA
jgi:hypothetical protein